jgi:hypothetical protein
VLTYLCGASWTVFSNRANCGRFLTEPADEIDTWLDERGLSGSGLRLKEGGQRASIAQFREARDRFGRKKWFRSVLKWTDIVLGSLASIPGLGIAVEPLKEWKESVEAQVDSETGEDPHEGTD